MIWKSLRAEPVRTKKEWQCPFVCLLRHAEASARCYIKLYNKWGWALWTGWPHRPVRVTRSPTCGSNKMAPSAARHVGDTAFQWSSLKRRNKSNKHCPSLTGRPWIMWGRPRQNEGCCSFYWSIYIVLTIWSFFLCIPHDTKKGEGITRCLRNLVSIYSSSQKLKRVGVSDSWFSDTLPKSVTFTLAFMKSSDVAQRLNLSLNLAHL